MDKQRYQRAAIAADDATRRTGVAHIVVGDVAGHPHITSWQPDKDGYTCPTCGRVVYGDDGRCCPFCDWIGDWIQPAR